MKKALSILLAVGLLVSSFSVGFAQDPPTIEKTCLVKCQIETQACFVISGNDLIVLDEPVLINHELTKQFSSATLPDVSEIYAAEKLIEDDIPRTQGNRNDWQTTENDYHVLSNLHRDPGLN